MALSLRRNLLLHKIFARSYRYFLLHYHSQALVLHRVGCQVLRFGPHKVSQGQTHLSAWLTSPAMSSPRHVYGWIRTRYAIGWSSSRWEGSLHGRNAGQHADASWRARGAAAFSSGRTTRGATGRFCAAAWADGPPWRTPAYGAARGRIRRPAWSRPWPRHGRRRQAAHASPFRGVVWRGRSTGRCRGPIRGSDVPSGGCPCCSWRSWIRPFRSRYQRRGHASIGAVNGWHGAAPGTARASCSIRRADGRPASSPGGSPASRVSV